MFAERSKLLFDAKNSNSSIHAIDPGSTIGPLLASVRYAFAFPNNSSLFPLVVDAMRVLDEEEQTVYR